MGMCHQAEFKPGDLLLPQLPYLLMVIFYINIKVLNV